MARSSSQRYPVSPSRAATSAGDDGCMASRLLGGALAPGWSERRGGVHVATGGQVTALHLDQGVVGEVVARPRSPTAAARTPNQCSRPSTTGCPGRPSYVVRISANLSAPAASTRLDHRLGHVGQVDERHQCRVGIGVLQGRPARRAARRTCPRPSPSRHHDGHTVRHQRRRPRRRPRPGPPSPRRSHRRAAPPPHGPARTCRPRRRSVPSAGPSGCPRRRRAAAR